MLLKFLLVLTLLLKFISVWVARRPPGYAFVEFADRRDAVDAIRGLDGEYKKFPNIIVKKV